MLVVLTGLCLYLMLKKMIDNKNLAKIDFYKDEYRLALFQFLHEGIKVQKLNVDSPLEIRALVELLASFSKTFSSEDIKARLQEFAEARFQPYILSQLQHRRWSKRMNALFWIHDFKMKSMKKPLHKLYTSKHVSKSEEIQLLKINVRFEEENLLENLIKPKHELTEFEYGLLFHSMKEEQFGPLIRTFDELPEVMKFALIDSIGVSNRMEYIPLLKELLEDDFMELRIRTLKAVVGMEYYLDVPTLSVHLRAASWQERLMAIKACEYIRTPQLTLYLTELMSDSSFYVRSQAAQSLLPLENGVAILTELAVKAEDGYARDMAIQWLERGSVS